MNPMQELATRGERQEREKGLRIENEQSQLNLDQAKRRDAATAELSDYTHKYLNGGGQSDTGGDQGLSMPEQLSGPGSDQSSDLPGLEKVGPQDAHHQLGFNLYQNTNLLRDPKYLNGAAEIFMRNRMPEGVAWLHNSYAASKENLIDATKLAVGGDLQGAERAFNSTGDHQVEPGSLQWKDDKKTILTGVNKSDGKPFEYDPQKMLKSFLSPKEFFAETETERKRAIEEKAAGSQENLRNAQADYYRGAKSALDRAKADKLGRVGDKELNTVIQKGGLALRKQIESEQSKEDSKFNVNGMVGLLPDMQKDLGQAIRNEEDPEVALSTVYNTYRDRVASLHDALSQITQAANSKWSNSGKDEAAKTGLQQFMQEKGVTADEIKKYLPATKLGKADQDRIGRMAGALKVTGSVNSDKVAEPKSQADFDALKSGEPYKNPSDGKIYKKK